jgi:hypothetical protein
MAYFLERNFSSDKFQKKEPRLIGVFFVFDFDFLLYLSDYHHLRCFLYETTVDTSLNSVLGNKEIIKYMVFS